VHRTDRIYWSTHGNAVSIVFYKNTSNTKPILTKTFNCNNETQAVITSLQKQNNLSIKTF